MDFHQREMAVNEAELVSQFRLDRLHYRVGSLAVRAFIVSELNQDECSVGRTLHVVLIADRRRKFTHYRLFLSFFVAAWTPRDRWFRFRSPAVNRSSCRPEARRTSNAPCLWIDADRLTAASKS